MKTRLWILTCLLYACNAAPVGVTPPLGEPVYEDTWTHANPGSKGPAVLSPSDANGKVARRISVEQLRRSIPQLFDGITWTIRVGRNDLDAFDALSRTLGEPDYITVTSENRDASPLFAKYMDDMAGDVCGKAIARDRAGAPGDRPLVMVKDDVDANLRYLRLALHGIWVPADSTEGLADLHQLYDDVFTETGDSGSAWYGVCVAMLTAPELMAY